MASSLNDPNNHAPPVSPTDEWDDAVGSYPARAAGGVSLPGKRKRSDRRHASANSLDSEPPGILIDTRRQDRTAEPPAERLTVVEYGREVIRLEQALDEPAFQAAKVIPALEPAPPEEPRELHGGEPDWGRARHHPLRWVAAAGVGAAVLLVAALAAQELYLAKTQKKARPAPVVELVEEVVPEEVKGFESDGPTEENARSMVAAYAKAKTPAEVLPLLRDAKRLARRLAQDWQPWEAPTDWQPTREARWTVSPTGGRSHATLRGLKPDFSPFQVYFVLDGDALLIDWEATEGLGDTTFAILQKGVGSGGVVRAYVSPDSFYSLAFPEEDYQSYRLLAPDREQFIWGYAKAGSAAAKALDKAFGSMEAGGPADLQGTIDIVETGKAAHQELPVTLRLIPALDGGQKNQWLIGEMLHIEWVSP